MDTLWIPYGYSLDTLFLIDDIFVQPDPHGALQAWFQAVIRVLSPPETAGLGETTKLCFSTYEGASEVSEPSKSLCYGAICAASESNLIPIKKTGSLRTEVRPQLQ